MPTSVIHKRTEPLRELVGLLDKAPVFAKGPYIRELVDQSLTLLAELCHERDAIERRLATLERFPELRAAGEL